MPSASCTAGRTHPSAPEPSALHSPRSQVTGYLGDLPRERRWHDERAGVGT